MDYGDKSAILYDMIYDIFDIWYLWYIYILYAAIKLSQILISIGILAKKIKSGAAFLECRDFFLLYQMTILDNFKVFSYVYIFWCKTLHCCPRSWKPLLRYRALDPNMAKNRIKTLLFKVLNVATKFEGGGETLVAGPLFFCGFPYISLQLPKSNEKYVIFKSGRTI